MLGARGDLDLGLVGLELRDDRVVPQASHFTTARRTLIRETVDGDEFVSEEERCLRPDEHVAHSAAVPTLPLRWETVDLATCDTDRSCKGAGLTLDPSLTADHERHDDDQVDAEQNEEGDRQRV